MHALDDFVSLKTFPHEVFLRLRDVSVCVKTDCPPLVDRLSSYFHSYIHPVPGKHSYTVYACLGEAHIDATLLRDVPRTGGKSPKESYYDTPTGRVVVKKRTGLVVFSTSSARYVIGDVLKHFNQVVNAIEQLYIEHYHDAGLVLLHAAAVADANGRGVLISSASGVGKSSAALATLERGFHFLSNDRVLLQAAEDETRVIGIPKKPRINPGTALALPSLQQLLAEQERARYLAMDRAVLWRLERKLDVDVDAVYGEGTTVLDAPLVLIFLLEWSPFDGQPLFEELDNGEAARQLARHMLGAGPYRSIRMATSGSPDLAMVTCQATCFRVRGGVDLPAFARHVVNRLGEELAI